jgi:GMP synthase-like glutamine amidotransferase
MKDILIVKHIPIEGPGKLGEYLERNGIGSQTVELSLGDKLPSSPQDFSAIVILGGPMNVYQEKRYSFLKEETRFIQQVLRTEVPLLGICLGAQLIAKAAGAKVYQAEAKEIGWYQVGLTPAGISSPLFCGLPESLFVFQWHGDTFDIPEGGELLATSDGCPHQAFRYGNCAYGLQFHLEVTAEMIKEWMRSYDTELEQLIRAGVMNRRDILRDTYKVTDEYYKNACRLFSNFLGLAGYKTRNNGWFL